MDFLFPEDEIIKPKITHVIKRDGRMVLFDKNKIVNSIYRAAVEVGGSNRALAEDIANRVISVINSNYLQGATPSVEEIQDIIEKELVNGGHYKTAKAYILYRAEHARIREGKNSRIIIEDNIPYKLLWSIFTWNVDHSCDTIEKINRHIIDGSFTKLIEDSENYFHDELKKLVDKIYRIRNDVKLLIVAGPSSSGKTTTSIKIRELLIDKGLNVSVINIDNYFKDLTEYPKDEYGDYDFENPQALDLNLINEHLWSLINGKTVLLPEYDFKTGKRRLNVKEFKLPEDGIIIIDSLHGLYPEMTQSIPHEKKFKIYIESLCQIRDSRKEFIRWTDLRMLRRMVRDSLSRGYDPVKTVGHWHYVRRSEKRYIVPFINKVDYVINSALSYELPFYKNRLDKYFPDIIRLYEQDPNKLDAYIRAERVYRLLNEVMDVQNDSIVPKNSIIREFIGGSFYNY